MSQRYQRYLWIGLAVLLVTAIVTLITHSMQSDITPSTPLDVTSALGGESTTGYHRAYSPRPFQFPVDHGPHPEFRNEWWYVTGHLADATGRQFGYQLTLFRIAMAPTPPVGDSAWRTHQVYMGHFALTDVQGKQHYAFERLSRGALGLAGAQAVPFRVWLDDWSLAGIESNVFPMRLVAREGAIALDLRLDSAKSLVLQGDQGLSQKSTEPGNASYYYSYTRLPTQGQVQLGEHRFDTTGTSWLDREWSTSALGPAQSGWDWFALQLDDQRELMVYRMRRKDGSTDPHSRAVLVDAAGQSRALNWNDLSLQPLGEWTSSTTGDRYPARWRLQLPSEKMDLLITPKLADQEMRLTVRYWEGAVTVTGQAGDRTISGNGYLEMTRYESPQSER